MKGVSGSFLTQPSSLCQEALTGLSVLYTILWPISTLLLALFPTGDALLQPTHSLRCTCNFSVRHIRHTLLHCQSQEPSPFLPILPVQTTALAYVSLASVISATRYNWPIVSHKPVIPLLSEVMTGSLQDLPDCLYPSSFAANSYFKKQFQNETGL